MMLIMKVNYILTQLVNYLNIGINLSMNTHLFKWMKKDNESILYIKLNKLKRNITKDLEHIVEINVHHICS